MHPGGDKNNPHKRWPVNKTITLVKHLAQNHPIIILLGPDEKELAKAFPLHKNIHVLTQASLFEVAAIIQKVNLLIHFDSSNGHIASAMRTKTLTIAGPTNTTRTAPWGEHNTTLRAKKPPLCSPCYGYLDFHFTCPHNIRCLKDILVEDVVLKANELLTQKNS